MGGFSYGFEAAGFTTVLGVDKNPEVIYPFKANHSGSFLLQDIDDLDPKYVQGKFTSPIRTILASPPCQDFSVANHKKKKGNQSRNNLVDSLARLLGELDFEFLAVENVPAIKKYPGYLQLKASLRERGYSLSDGVVDFSNYGVPQTRTRNILLASKFGTVKLVPSATKTIKDYIGHLPPVAPGETSLISPLHSCPLHSPTVIKRIQAAREAGSILAVPEELKPKRFSKSGARSSFNSYEAPLWNGLSRTITSTSYTPNGFGSIHPLQNRAFTLLEMLLLQTFPQDYKIVNSTNFNKESIARMIGNAVPPQFSKAIGEAFIRQLPPLASVE